MLEYIAPDHAYIPRFKLLKPKKHDGYGYETLWLAIQKTIIATITGVLNRQLTVKYYHLGLGIVNLHWYWGISLSKL